MFYWDKGEIFITLFGFDVYWYGLTMFVGVVAGVFVTYVLFRRYREDIDFFYNIIPFLVIGGFFGARIYHIINEYDYYLENIGDVFLIKNGGLAIHGAVMAGVLVLWLFIKKYCVDVGKRKNSVLSFLYFADIFIPGLAIGQAIGRWGNFFNQELYGRPTDFFLSVYIEPQYRQIGFESFSFFHPVFFYESLGLLFVFLFLFLMHRYRIRKGEFYTGAVLSVYFILYGVLRVFMEFMRIDSVPTVLNIRLPMLVSFLLIVVGIFIMWYIKRYKYILKIYE